MNSLVSLIRNDQFDGEGRTKRKTMVLMKKKHQPQGRQRSRTSSKKMATPSSSPLPEMSNTSMLSMTEEKMFSFDGFQGFVLRMPGGNVVNNEDFCCTIDSTNKKSNVKWAFKFFENLHMDLSVSTREHLHHEIDRIGREIYKEGSNNNRNYDARPQDDRRDDDQCDSFFSSSPIIDLEYKSVPVQEEDENSPSRTQALVVIHEGAMSRITREEQQQNVVMMGRLFLPVRHGLFEVIVTAEEEPVAASVADTIHDDLMEYSFSSQASSKSSNSKVLGYLNKNRREDCLDRVRNAMSWLLSTEAKLVVTEPPADGQQAVEGTGFREVELRQLRCKLTLPPRFMYSPNPSSPESNKHRFCRASFGGSEGVQAIVVSCWYGNHIQKGARGLKEVALHGARAIHELQQYKSIQISERETKLHSNTRHRRNWLPHLSGVGNRDAVVTTVTCQEAYGVRRQNTIGWVRESNSGVIFLVYYIDTLGLDSATVETEIIETLASIRVPRLHPKTYAWNIQNLIVNKSTGVRRQQGMLTGPQQGMLTGPTRTQPV